MFSPVFPYFPGFPSQFSPSTFEVQTGVSVDPEALQAKWDPRVYKWGYPKNAWFIRENLMYKWMMTGGTLKK